MTVLSSWAGKGRSHIQQGCYTNMVGLTGPELLSPGTYQLAQPFPKAYVFHSLISLLYKVSINCRNQN